MIFIDIDSALQSKRKKKTVIHSYLYTPKNGL